MAKYCEAYRFQIYNINFDLTFIPASAKLDYGKDVWYHVTVVLIRIPKTVQTMGVKTVCNPKDIPDYIKGQQQAFKRAIEFIWATQVDINKISLKSFLHRASQIAFNAGMWNEE